MQITLSSMNFLEMWMGKFSTYLYKDLRDRAKLVVWDFNNAFDNQIEGRVDEADFTLTDTRGSICSLRTKHL